MIEYIEKKYIQKNSVEKRDYQINLANQAIHENCIVVLPTGLGKTTIALHVISEYLLKESGTILFLAPTRVLVNQHFDFLQKNGITPNNPLLFFTTINSALIFKICSKNFKYFTD